MTEIERAIKYFKLQQLIKRMNNLPEIPELDTALEALCEKQNRESPKPIKWEGCVTIREEIKC